MAGPPAAAWLPAASTAVLLLVFAGLVGDHRAAARKEADKTPYPCKEQYAPDDIASWVANHLAPAKENNEQPHMLLMLGGSGAGKGTFTKRWRELEKALPDDGSPRLRDFVAHGLDEYLDYIPEYVQTIKDPDSVYRDAADACYPGAAIPAAKLAGSRIVERKIHLIYEETGKNLDRIKKRVLPPFVEAGYRVTVVLVDNDPETAIARAAGRFQSSGRYASEEYIRGTFSGCFASFESLKRMDAVKEAVYCDNSGADLLCWRDGAAPPDALVPASLLKEGAPEYRTKPRPEGEL